MAKKDKDVQASEEVACESESMLIAKKAFIIRHNDYYREIKPGDDLSDIPELYHENLKTEGVL